MRRPRTVRTLLPALLDFVFPTDCGHCGRPLDVPARHGFCLSCWSAVRPLRPPLCPDCGLPTAPGTSRPAAGPRRRCRWCVERPLGVDGVRAAVLYEGPARSILLRAKVGRRPEILEDLAGHLVAVARAAGLGRGADLIVAVPSPVLRRAARGFDAAAIFAARLSAAVGRPFVPRALRRTRPFAPSVKRLRRDERARALARGFRASRKRVAGRRVLLVDDVVTSGATVRACAGALRDAGARSIRVACWARTPV